MANNIIPNVNPGDLVGSTPTFPINAVVKGDFLYLRDANGNQILGITVSDGDEITVLDIGYSKQLVLVQYPTSSGYRQGYVTNATSIIKYKDDYSWVNGSTPEAVYDLDKTTQIGTLDPRERAVVLYKVDGMTAVAYDTGKGKLTKSGLVHYEGSGSSNGGGSINGIAPGEVVPGGFTYENNAQVVGDELYLRDANGNQISGRVVSNGDKITVLDVGYTKQLALVQYPAGSVVRQGYVTNATNLIRYFKQGEWLNGSTTEYVLDENGGSLGSLSPYEAATPLYKKNGMTHVVYDTSKGPNTKSGYVKFEGLPELPDTGIQIPSVSHSQATVEVYGLSGRSRQLKVYKIGSGSKVLFAGFALHGWEDKWDNDGLALVNIANSLISKIGDYKAQNGLHGWTVYIAPCMNPDGVVVRGTHNGPGRCAVKSRVDMNRCFPRGFSAQYNSRNYTGPEALGAQEAVALKNFIEKINKTADELVVIDAHGWLGCTYGSSSIAQYFTNQFGFSHKGESFGGYFSYWAQGLPRTRGLLLEYPNTNSYSEVLSRNYIGKTFNAIINILKNNPNGGDGDTNTDSNYDKWVNKDGKWYYYENGKMVTGWKLVDGEWYYLGSDGVMVTGWIELGGIWYYLSDSGAMVKGWQTISGKTYYFNDSGHMLTGKQVIDGKNYEFNESGHLISGDGGISSSEVTYIAVGKVINVQSFLNVRKGPGTNYDSIGQVYQGDKVSIVAKNGTWYKIEYGSGYGYVHSNFINIVLDEDINKKILKFAGNTGFFENMNLEFEFFNKRIPLGAISFSPLITVEAEISLNMKLDNGSKINLTLTPDELTAEFLGKFNALGVTSSIDKRHLTSVFEKLTLSRNVIDGFRYQVILGPAGTINVTFESTFEYDFGNGNKESIYQRLYFTIHPHLNPNLPSVVRIADIDIETDETVKIEDKNIMQLIHKGIVQFVSYVHYQFSKITIPDIKPITPQQVSIIGSVALGVIIILACVLV
ncbi:SH3 domain-containing protein [Clostridium perfringens]|uniref:SH3 domain-containing protein n=1 Tax=Clostridium perfringens TaxID=1502 RepID=UPI002409BBD0|nr:SH3 domain-containing protein [Clostridium perfringens]WFB45409.1 SH3 domain-containing protein [Clostridium perfringens]WFD76978.1 SH3 domain-containing protein [Clostridium perfringens]